MFPAVRYSTVQYSSVQHSPVVHWLSGPQGCFHHPLCMRAHHRGKHRYKEPLRTVYSPALHLSLPSCKEELAHRFPPSTCWRHPLPMTEAVALFGIGVICRGYSDEAVLQMASRLGACGVFAYHPISHEMATSRWRRAHINHTVNQNHDR